MVTESLRRRVSRLMEVAAQESGIPTTFVGLASMPLRQNVGGCPKLVQAIEEGSIPQTVTPYCKEGRCGAPLRKVLYCEDPKNRAPG